MAIPMTDCDENRISMQQTEMGKFTNGWHNDIGDVMRLNIDISRLVGE